MARRPDKKDALTESDLAELRRNLSLLSGASLADCLRQAHRGSLERKPEPKAMQCS